MQYPQPNAPYPPLVPEKRRFGAISALLLSFFSGSLYRDVARRWRGFGFWYLVLLLIVTWTPWAIQAHRGFAKFVRTDAPATVEGFPSITINNGQVSIAEPEPYLWKDPQSGQVMLYVDTTGAFDLPQGKNALVKLSKSKVDLRKSAVETQTYDLSGFKSFYIDKSILLGWLGKASPWIGPSIVAWGLTGALVYHLVQFLIFAAIGMAIASSMGAKMSYGAMMRVTAVAITPAMILSMFIGFANIDSCSIYLLYLIIEWVAIVLAIKANTEGQAGRPGGFAVYPPGYGVAPGDYPQQPPMGGYGVPPGQFPPMPPQYPQPPR